MLRIGSVVQSTAGRDRHSLQLVTALQGKRVLLTDGKAHPFDRPKSKNIRHIKDTGLQINIDSVTGNKALKKMLGRIEAELNGNT